MGGIFTLHLFNFTVNGSNQMVFANLKITIRVELSKLRLLLKLSFHNLTGNLYTLKIKCLILSSLIGPNYEKKRSYTSRRHWPEYYRTAGAGVAGIETPFEFNPHPFAWLQIFVELATGVLRADCSTLLPVG